MLSAERSECPDVKITNMATVGVKGRTHNH